MSVSTRPLSIDDTPAMAELVRANREFLAPWEPIRDEDYYTDAGQAALIAALLERYERGTTIPHVILDGERVVGRITLNDLVRGPFQSCHLGYWVGQADNGRGVASASAQAMIALAFGELGLHRIQAGTLVHNTGSQRVLERNGFVRFGLAPQYLNIAGQWQDHILYQLISPVA